MEESVQLASRGELLRREVMQTPEVNKPDRGPALRLPSRRPERFLPGARERSCLRAQGRCSRHGAAAGAAGYTRLMALERQLRCCKCGARGKASLEVELRLRD